MTERIPKGGTRCSYPECKRPARFSPKGKGHRTDKMHDLCARHWRDELNRQRPRNKKK